MHISYKALTYVNSALTGGQLAMTANNYVHLESDRVAKHDCPNIRGPL